MRVRVIMVISLVVAATFPVSASWSESASAADKVAPSGRLCFTVAGSAGDAALVNLTPVEADGLGFGQLVSSNISNPPLASNVNFGPGTFDPNVAVAPIGPDGRVCYVNSNHTSVHLVADHLGTITAASFLEATASGAPLRTVDTRTNTPPPPASSTTTTSTTTTTTTTSTTTTTTTTVPTCDPSYPTVCIPSPPPVLNCGDIPYRDFAVRPPDPHGFDGNNDGIGCLNPSTAGQLVTSVVGSGSISVAPQKAEYQIGEQVTLTAVPSGGSTFSGWSGSVSASTNPVVVTIGASTSVTATFVASSTAPQIDVWYGLDQQFGQLGVPQVAVNVVGNVSDPDGVSSPVYSLNGGPSRVLRLGPDKRRLARPGDFNVELPVVDLNDGSNGLVLTATDSNGKVSTVNVNVEFSAGNVWPTGYSIDWSTVTDVQDVAQVVDGKWELLGDGLRIVEPSYDRLVAIGDVAWTEYEVTFPVTINAIDETGFSSGASGRGAGLGLIARWAGHTDHPVVTSEPKSGWNPHGAIGWWWWASLTSARLKISGNYSDTIASGPSGTPPAVGTTLMYRMRVETDDAGYPWYYLKVWPAAQAEPSAWTLAGKNSLTDPVTGSIVLVAHHVDATFGDIIVTPLDADPPA